MDSILECGCNIRRNIRRLELVLPNTKPSAIEIRKPHFGFLASQYAVHKTVNESIEDSKFPQVLDLVSPMYFDSHSLPAAYERSFSG
jgi:hypothetical protein